MDFYCDAHRSALLDAENSMIHSLVETARFAMQHGDYDDVLAYLDDIETHTEVLYRRHRARARHPPCPRGCRSRCRLRCRAEEVTTPPRAPQRAPRKAKVIVKKKKVTPVPRAFVQARSRPAGRLAVAVAGAPGGPGLAFGAVMAPSAPRFATRAT